MKHKNNSLVQSIFLEQSSKILPNSPTQQSLSHNITYLASALEIKTDHYHGEFWKFISIHG